jgi:BirA family biotin operon repressor/biotin-[acetyl-CoA-carboxylase] ligase
MKLKEQVLLILMSSKGNFVSGEEISKQLYVSRNAVWKAINSLRADGFIIDAAQNKGYLLSGGETDDFTRYGILRIRQLLKKSAADADITIKDTVTSTNTLLRISAENGAPSKTVLIANEQTEGRGRHGKSFYSPADTGIYMSVLLRPDFKADKAFFITAGAAVSVVRAIKKVCGIKAGIKWINDIMLNGKKICGILTEAVTDFESGSLQYAVMGLGVNISRPKGGFPSEISDIASSLYSEEAAGNELKCALAAEILNNFFDICERMSVDKLTEEYKSYSVVLGKRIRVISSNAEYYATAVDIDKNARLIVRDENGDMHTLSSAEVSVREGQI